MSRRISTIPEAPEIQENDSILGLDGSVVRRFSFTRIYNYLLGRFNSIYANRSHTHIASDVTDFDTEVDNNATVVLNTAKVSFPGFGGVVGQVENWAETGNNTVIPTAKVSDAVITSITNQTISPRIVNIGNTLTVASDVTLGSSSGTLDNFLQTIEDAGGRQDIELVTSSLGLSIRR